MKRTSILLVAGALAACTPAYNWHNVRDMSCQQLTEARAALAGRNQTLDLGAAGGGSAIGGLVVAGILSAPLALGGGLAVALSRSFAGTGGELPVQIEHRLKECNE